MAEKVFEWLVFTIEGYVQEKCSSKLVLFPHATYANEWSFRWQKKLMRRRKSLYNIQYKWIEVKRMEIKSNSYYEMLILSLRQHTNENEQSTLVQVPMCLRKIRLRNNAAAVKICVSIYVGIAKCRRQIPGCIKRRGTLKGWWFFFHSLFYVDSDNLQ